MVRLATAIAALLAGAPLAAQPAAQPTATVTPAAAAVAPAAKQLFESDWVLMNWALKFHDANRDIMIEPAEAAEAAAAFRALADADNDGRITRLEYRQARAFILARY